MKAIANRNIRRRRKAPSDGSFFKKESQEPGFFAESGPQPFFQPAAQPVQRKCAECEEEHKAKGNATITGEEVPEEQQSPEAQPANEVQAAEEEPCTAGSVSLEAETTGKFKKGAGTLIGEKKEKSKGCPTCEEDCVDGSGVLSVPFNVLTSVALPPVPQDLTPCQQARVKAAIDGPLTAHEQEHVAAFKTFDGTALLPISYHGCNSGYDPYLVSLAENELRQREFAAKQLSAALDPFSIPVDLCCREPKPKETKPVKK